MPTSDVVVGVDGSPAALHAARWAALAAARRGVVLRVVSVYEGEGHRTVESAAYAEQARAKAMTALRDAVSHLDRTSSEHPPLVTEIVAGSPAAVLVERAERAALLVVGYDRRAPHADRSALGSTGAAVATAGRGVTAVVPSNALIADPRHVVLALDLEHDTAPLLEHAVDEARTARCHLRVVHAVRHPDRLRRQYDEAWTSVVAAEIDREVAPLTTRAGVDWSVYVRVGEPADAVASLLTASDLLVLGGRHHGVATVRVLGSVAARLLPRSPCPVVVVHPSRASGRARRAADDKRVTASG